MVDSLDNEPPSLVLSQSHLNIRSQCGGKGLVTTRYPFHLYGSEAISETEDNRPNIMTKDAPIVIIAEEIPRF